MKKTVILVLSCATLLAMTVSTASAQRYTKTALPAAINETLQGLTTAYANSDDNHLFLAMVNATYNTTILRWDQTTGVVDTFPSAINRFFLPHAIAFNGTKVYVGGENYSGHLAAHDSLGWVGDISSMSSIHFMPASPYGSNLTNHQHGGSINGIEVFGGVPLFSGLFKFANSGAVPDTMSCVGYLDATADTFAQGQLSYLPTFGFDPNVAMVKSKLSPAGAVLYYQPGRFKRAVSVHSGLGFNIISLLPVPATCPAFESVFSFQNRQYVIARDTASNMEGIFRYNSVSLTYDTLALIWGGEKIADFDTLGGSLIFAVNGNTGYDSLNNRPFYPLTGFDGTNFFPMVYTVADTYSGIAVIGNIRNGIVHGSFTSLDGQPFFNFCKLTFADTVPPVVSLVGPDTVTVQHNAVYADAGATAVDAMDGSVPTTVDYDSVNTAIVGTYHLRYKATDGSANIGFSPVRTVIVTPLLGIPAESQNAQKIWSVPGAIMASGFDGSADLSVYDLTGQSVATESFSDRVTIDAHDLSAGMYIVTITQGAVRTTRKVVLH